jgi:site-specific recombinase XerD
MVRFHLDKKTGTESPIFLSLHHRGTRIKVYTGKKIDALKWDLMACRANPRKYKNNCVGFNAFLQGISDEVEKLVNENRPISKSDLKTIVDKANGKNTNDTFYGFAESYIQQQISKGELKPASAKAYRGTVSYLKKISPSLTFENVDLNFYDKFVEHLKAKEKLSENSIGGHVKRLKWFMAAALDRDIHSNVAFRKKRFKAPTEETDQIYLTRKEIKQLGTKKLPERLKRIADTFVMNCYLGIRFSDLQQVRKENFKKEQETYFLHMVQEKTEERISIPIPQEALLILRKYKFSCPVEKNGKLISVQKFNEYLKEAAKDAGLDDQVDIRSSGKVEKFPKHSLIKSHTARRTFATNLFLEGVPIQDIMAVTGHRKEETFLLYVRADQLTKSKGLARHYEKKSKPEMKVTRGGKSAA